MKKTNKWKQLDSGPYQQEKTNLIKMKKIQGAKNKKTQKCPLRKKLVCVHGPLHHVLTVHPKRG